MGKKYQYNKFMSVQDLKPGFIDFCCACPDKSWFKTLYEMALDYELLLMIIYIAILVGLVPKNYFSPTIHLFIIYIIGFKKEFSQGFKIFKVNT